MNTKNKFFLLFFLSAYSLFSQDVDMDIHGYSKVINTPEMQQNELYVKLKEWLALNYKSANNVIQLDTKEKIIVKGNFSYFSKTFNNDIVFAHTLIFSIKDFKTKIELIIPEKVISTIVYGQNIETFILEEELKNTVTYDVLVKRFSDSYKESNGNEKKLNKALEKNSQTLKTKTLPFKKELSDNLNKKVQDLYQSIEKFIFKTDEW
ncbi:DUF4468 domain-containing protein [Mariniflexile gromovii]|uniref:DUF4468 domain-containing protein n=1 Tax=Mariniflexile gromovii TaxID=362523 RepID=A0ABS4BQQ2_9FLAO|nr:DUF4468 domain-containing protein [Mariniflexile gromovii]MBP0902912.1 DUF4468 domain-containing protein [Mariniflexile gromovii]